ncbi:MAG TPA: pitrilysin family protein [Thermoanaerobaculia bacterium]|nr:pitrilysin family protein [Thermoanaerobaculia bacterium]
MSPGSASDHTNPGAPAPSPETKAPSPAEVFELVREKGGIREWRHRRNGLQLLLLQNRVAPVATFAVVYRVGSRNEAVGHTGATHLLEHLMFKGTPEYRREAGTAIAAVLEALGARFNATTWFDRTNYYETVPSDAIETVVRLEASRMRRSLLRDEDRAPEMTVVRNEFERGENSPFQVLYKQSFATAFREHPYHHPTIGWKSDIEGVTTERLREFYDVFYHPNNATAMLIGDFEESEGLALIERHFGPIPASPRPIPRIYTVEPPQEGERRFEVRRTGQVAWVALSWRSVEAAHPDTPALAVLGNVLGGGLTSRLYQALVESNLTLSITVVPWQLRDPALFSIFAPVRPGVAAATVETVIREETARLSASGVTDAEVRKAQTQIEAEIVFDRDSTDQIAASLSEAIAVADWQWYVDYPAAVARVTTEDVRRIAQSTFRGEALTVGVFQPRDPGGAAAEDGAPEPGGEEAS